MLGTVKFNVESLSAARAADKLVQAGVAVLSVREMQKNVLDFEIRAKDMKKAFAILQSSCYNIKNVRYCGLARLQRVAMQGAGLLLGVLLFFGAVTFAETRVLKVEVVGNGAYYEREVLSLLEEAGVKRFSAMPRDTGALVASILALPRVEFCSFKGRGGILTVEVNCAENTQPIAGMPLASPVSGVIEELTVVRGTPLKAVGDEVQEGEIVVADHTVIGEREYPVLVIAKVTVRREIEAEYELSEEGARAQALLEFGELTEIHTEKTQRGWRIRGVAHASASVNLG